MAENVSDEMLVLSESLLRRIWEVALALKAAEEEDGEHRSARKILFVRSRLLRFELKPVEHVVGLPFVVVAHQIEVVPIVAALVHLDKRWNRLS